MVERNDIRATTIRFAIRFLILISIISCGVHHDPAPAGTTTTQSGNPPPTSGTSPGAVTYTWISANILVPKCVSCHGGAEGTYAGVSYTSYSKTMQTVTAGQPAHSLLYTDSESGYMPFMGTKLSAEHLSALSAWITAGAKND